jgi:hypothetical protein
VGFIDHHEVVITPDEVLQIDVAGESGVTREIGVIEDFVVEAVCGEDVATVVCSVKGPVVPESFWAKDKDTVTAELVILDHGECFEGFSQTYAVCDDATTKAVQLVDGAHYAITLELEELVPDDGFLEACCGFDNGLFI